MTALRIAALGSVQIAALDQEILDPIHAEAGDAFPGSLEGTVLTVERADFPKAQSLLEDAVNGCGEPGPGHDAEYEQALRRVLQRLRWAENVAQAAVIR